MLRWGWEPPMSSEQFLEDCRYALTIVDYHYVAQAALLWEAPLEHETPPQTKGTGGAAAQWEEFRRGLQGDLARLRAQALGIEPPPIWNYSTTIYSYERVQEALNAPHPLAAEEMLDQLCWQWLEDMIEHCAADVDRLYLYYLQLQLLQRQHQRQEASAQKYYNESYQSVVRQLSLVGLT